MTPPLTPEKIFRRTGASSRDRFRNNNVTVDLGNYVHEWNEERPDKPDMHYQWFTDELTDEERNKRAKKIIDDVIRSCKHLEDWYGPKTYRECHADAGTHMEWLVKEVSKEEQMGPYTQGERLFPIRKLIMQKFEAKHKWYVAKKKRSAIHVSAIIGSVEMTTPVASGVPVILGDSNTLAPSTVPDLQMGDINLAKGRESKTSSGIAPVLVGINDSQNSIDDVNGNLNAKNSNNDTRTSLAAATVALGCYDSQDGKDETRKGKGNVEQNDEDGEQMAVVPCHGTVSGTELQNEDDEGSLTNIELQIKKLQQKKQNLIMKKRRGRSNSGEPAKGQLGAKMPRPKK